jgi:hypothetical protein
MTLDACSPATSASVLADRGSPSMRCADAARVRGEPLQASAVRYRRFLLLEVPGSWGSSTIDEKLMDAEAARRLTAAAADADAHIVMIRRPGRHPVTESLDTRLKAWAFADVSSGTGSVLWGAWRDPSDLLALDLCADAPGEANAAGPQRVVLVCTNGKRDLCCAVRGRPVAEAIAAGTDWDTWECSHLGGHRFAATLMLLPAGDMFGWLDPGSAVEVLRRFDAGQLMLNHYRGQAGQPVPVQAALQDAAIRLGEFRRDALRASSVRQLDDADRWEIEVIHRTERNPGTAYRMIMAGSQLAPAFHSCADTNAKAEIRYETLSFSRVDAEALSLS